MAPPSPPRRMASPPERARHRAVRTVTSIIGVLVLVLVSLQLFLLMVALDAAMTLDDGLAWGSALASVALAGCAAFLYGYLRRP